MNARIVSRADIYKNGTSQANTTGTSTALQSGLKIFIGANSETNVAQTFSSKQMAFAFIGRGLDATQTAALTSTVNNFQGYVETAFSMASGTRKKF